MENRIKEQQLDLLADRTSTQTFDSNQLRLWLHSIELKLFLILDKYNKFYFLKDNYHNLLTD